MCCHCSQPLREEIHMTVCLEIIRLLFRLVLLNTLHKVVLGSNSGTLFKVTYGIVMRYCTNQRKGVTILINDSKQVVKNF